MKLERKIMTVCACLLVATAALAQRPVAFGLLDGHYERRHTVTTLDSDEPATDWLTLQHEERGYHFDTELAFDFKGKCVITGFAIMEDDRDPFTLTYRQPVDQATGRPCVLQLQITSDHITFNDPRYSCNSFCGLGGSIHGARFDRATREGLE